MVDGTVAGDPPASAGTSGERETTAPTAIPYLLLAPSLLLLGLLFGTALVLLLALSLSPGAIPVQPGSSVRFLGNYVRFLADTYYLGQLAVTLEIGLLVTAACALLGYPVAYSLAKAPPGRRRLMMAIIVTPLLTDPIIRAYGWVVILGNEGPLNRLLLRTGLVDAPVKLMYNWLGVVIGLVHFLLPFMILSIASVLQKLDVALEEASLNLGHTRFGTFRRVLLPLSLPGVMAGSTIVFTLCISAFVTPQILGGGAIQMLPNLIYQQIVELYDLNFGSAMALILLVVALGGLLGFQVIARRLWAEGQPS